MSIVSAAELVPRTIRMSRTDYSFGPAFQDIFHVGRHLPDKSLFLDLAFVCDDGPVWVNRAIAVARSGLIRDIVSMHACCGCGGFRCVSDKEVRIVLPGVKSDDLEKVFELIYLGYSIVDSIQTYCRVKDVLRMLAMEIAPDLAEVSVVDVHAAFGGEDVGQGSSSSGESNRKRIQAKVIEDVELRRTKRKKGCDDNEDGFNVEDEDDVVEDYGDRSDFDDEDYVADEDNSDGDDTDDFDDDDKDADEDNSDGDDTDDFDDDNEGVTKDSNNDDGKPRRSVEAESVTQRRHEEAANDKIEPAALKARIKGADEKVKNFKCQQCNYSTRTKCNLKTHVKLIHDKIKDFNCDKCDFSFGLLTSLKIHIKTVHENVRDFKCDKCDYSTGLAGNLKIHIKAVHDKIRDFKCKQCSCSFSQASSLKTHIARIHGTV